MTVNALAPPQNGPYHSSKPTADDAGRWKLANVACIAVGVAAFKTGFLPGRNGNLPTKASSDGSSENLRLPLMPEVAVAGTVTDDQGKPVPAAEVVAVSGAAVGGHRILREGQRVAVDPNGQFRHGGLDPLPYAICAMSNPDDLARSVSPWSSYSKSCVPDEHSGGSLRLEGRLMSISSCTELPERAFAEESKVSRPVRRQLFVCGATTNRPKRSPARMFGQILVERSCSTESLRVTII